jgi:glucose-1-phosphate thymidylyltransferase
MKGIILAGGTATRLQPASLAVNKQLMPVYDKPLIYYPLTTLMLSGIHEFLVIANSKDIEQYKSLFAKCGKWGIEIQFAEQVAANGIAEALIIAEGFISNSPVALILGDNFFHGNGLGRELKNLEFEKGATVSAFQVSDPKAFGVVEFDSAGNVISLEEKPINPKSSWAVPGLYFYDETAPERSKSLKPSPRGELEITDLNKTYLLEGILNVIKFPRGTTWLDMGTPKSLMNASEYVQVIQDRQGLLIGSPEEAAWRAGWITTEQLEELSSEFNNDYGTLLKNLIRDRSINEL